MKSPSDLNITPFQFKNLAKLVTYVHQNAPYLCYNQRVYNSYSPNITCDVRHVCGSVACFAGHGPAAGIKTLDNETWYDYIARVFNKVENDLYYTLFSGYHLNSAGAAARRGAWCLEHGLPDALYLARWEAPEDYVPDWAEIARVVEKDMTMEEQHLALASMAGWKVGAPGYLYSPLGVEYQVMHGYQTYKDGTDILPDYLYSRDALMDLFKTFQTLQKQRVIRELIQVIDDTCDGELKVSDVLDPIEMQVCLFEANCEMLREAILRSVDKWL